ncbi:MAG: hypothetical protein O3B72_00260 [Proteobacteria bacterium]|nr:hypothetical protein [Pseudomonadota bacterium]
MSRKTSASNAVRILALVLPVTALLLWSRPAAAELHVAGYVKSFAVAQDQVRNDLISEPVSWQSQNSLRLMLEGFSSRTVWQIHYELSPVLVSRQVGAGVPTFNVVSGSYRLTDPATSLGSDNPRRQVYQNLDRLNIQFQFDAGDLTIGRQPISFGAARMINPTDVFLPFDLRTFNTEYRNGLDAIRFQKPWGDLGEIDVGVVIGEDARRENSAAFLQLRGNVNGKDLHFALINYAEQTLVGVGLQTAIGDTGFWLEAASVNGDDNYLRLSTGVDYAFNEDIFGQLEYHYNGAGRADPADYLASLSSLPYQKGGVFLLGRDYLMPVITVQLSPLWSLATQAVINLSDQSRFTSLSLEFNVASNVYMDFGFYHFSGDDLSISRDAVPVLGSEYGTNPDTLYMSVRYYF